MSSKREYQPGDIVGKGKPVKQYRDGAEAALYGSGTVDDPYIYWFTQVEFDHEAYVEAHNKIVRIMAKELAPAKLGPFKCGVVRAASHSTARIQCLKTGLDVIKPANAHLSVLYGQDIDHCQIEGHIYTIEEFGIPIGVAQPEQRTIVYPGYKPVSVEMWGIDGVWPSPKRKAAWVSKVERDTPETQAQGSSEDMTNGNKPNGQSSQQSNRQGGTAAQGNAPPGRNAGGRQLIVAPTSSRNMDASSWRRQENVPPQGQGQTTDIDGSTIVGRKGKKPN